MEIREVTYGGEYSTFQDFQMVGDDFEVVGSVSLQESEGPFITDVWVDADLRRQGIASALLQRALEQRPTEVYWLYVYPENLTAQALYKKHGFEIVGKAIESGDDVFIMKRFV